MCSYVFVYEKFFFFKSVRKVGKDTVSTITGEDTNYL